MNEQQGSAWISTDRQPHGRRGSLDEERLALKNERRVAVTALRIRSAGQPGRLSLREHANILYCACRTSSITTLPFLSAVMTLWTGA